MNKFIIILVLLIFGCKKSENTNINKIVVHAVDLNIDTSTDVSCEDFALTFNKRIKVFSIDEKSTLTKFEFLLNKSKKKNKNVSLDVRRKIIIYYKDNSIDSLCIDRFNIVINNQLIDKNDEFLDFVFKL